MKTVFDTIRKTVNRARYLSGRLIEGPEGRRRAQRVLALRLLRGEADSVAFHRDGMAWTIPVGDRIISKVLFETGGFQLDKLQALVAWLETNDSRWTDKDWILDVGANIGTSTIPLALETGRRVLALEPDPSNFGYLQANVAANDLRGRVTCVQVAISNRAGKIKMVVDPASSGSTEVWEVGMPSPGNGLIDVDAETLDEILHAQGISPTQVAVVWSDTEGFERQVIESGRSLWTAGVPLYVEVWPPGLSRHGGMEELGQAMAENFDRMIGADELVGRGAGAVSRPVRDFGAYISTQPAIGGDVLLIPSRG